MIPLHKLKELPYSQGLRKTAKIFEQAERQYVLENGLPKDDIVYLAGILDYLTGCVPVKLGKALNDVRDYLTLDITQQQSQIALQSNNIRRSLNTVHHLLKNETGQFTADWDYETADSKGKLNLEKRNIFLGMEIYLEDIRSPFNVGAIFRCAESFGVEKIHLSPFCADPNHPRAKRTAMGCVSALPWQRLEDDPFNGTELSDSTDAFPPETAFFALETGGTTLEDFHFPARGVMIIGSEELGVSPKALTVADASMGRVSIPILGAKGSLNVSVAFGIVIHAWAAALQKELTGV